MLADSNSTLCAKTCSSSGFVALIFSKGLGFLEFVEKQLTLCVEAQVIVQGFAAAVAAVGGTLQPGMFEVPRALVIEGMCSSIWSSSNSSSWTCYSSHNASKCLRMCSSCCQRQQPQLLVVVLVYHTTDMPQQTGAYAAAVTATSLSAGTAVFPPI